MPVSNLPDFRHTRTTSLTMLPPNAHSQDSLNPMAGPSRFDGPRSPPNTSHVPCKFFRQGACQAGNSCPFSHDIGAATETVCKYFAKGNCKFGPKCANIHVLPDGRRVNYGKNGVTIGTAPLGLGSRINPTAYLQPSNSALTNSFLNATANGHSSYNGTADERFHGHTHQLGRQPSMEGGLPGIETTYSSNPASTYGSPPGTTGLGAFDDHSRASLGLSPVNVKVLSVMDAPLPASFDSNGISHAARYGPWPASVPSKFGLESPSPSLHGAKEDRTSETLKLLHTSAFGSSDHLSPSNLAPHDNIIGSSPTNHNGHDEYYSRRTMHSSSQRYAKPRLISSSAPKADNDWDNDFLFLEEDYVPGALANEVLTPQEKARRGSLRVNDSDGLSEAPTASGSASANATKFGSPVTNNAASSPSSRWSPWFQQRQQRDDETESAGLSRSMKHAASAFGHVGSPLRNSSLANNNDLSGIGTDFPIRSISTSLGASRAGDETLSVLTQQLQRTRITEDTSGSSSPRFQANGGRHPPVALSTATVTTAAASGIIGRDRDRDRERTLDRHVSSGSISSGAPGRFPTPIDEEDPAFVFNMEELDEASQMRALKRRSGGLSGINGGSGSSIWSYAGIVSGKDTSKTRDPSNPIESVGGR